MRIRGICRRCTRRSCGAVRHTRGLGRSRVGGLRGCRFRPRCWYCGRRVCSGSPATITGALTTRRFSSTRPPAPCPNRRRSTTASARSPCFCRMCTAISCSLRSAFWSSSPGMSGKECGSPTLPLEKNPSASAWALSSWRSMCSCWGRMQRAAIRCATSWAVCSTNFPAARRGFWLIAASPVSTKST